MSRCYHTTADVSAYIQYQPVRFADARKIRATDVVRPIDTSNPRSSLASQVPDQATHLALDQARKLREWCERVGCAVQRTHPRNLLIPPVYDCRQGRNLFERLGGWTCR
jgi:hypothetical protein